MSIDSSIVPVMPMTPPNGELLYASPYIGGKTEIDEYGNVQITHGYLRADWDGVVDSLQTYPGLVYDGSYPLISNNSGGILYLDQGQDVIENPTEPSDLKNTKSNIRKIKPDINSELKRV